MKYVKFIDILYSTGLVDVISIQSVCNGKRVTKDYDYIINKETMQKN